MATSPTKTVKISQTIMLDIDFAKIEDRKSTRLNSSH